MNSLVASCPTASQSRRITSLPSRCANSPWGHLTMETELQKIRRPAAWALTEKVERLRHARLWLLEHRGVPSTRDHHDFDVVDVMCELLRVAPRQHRVLGAPQKQGGRTDAREQRCGLEHPARPDERPQRIPAAGAPGVLALEASRREIRPIQKLSKRLRSRTRSRACRAQLARQRSVLPQ